MKKKANTYYLHCTWCSLNKIFVKLSAVCEQHQGSPTHPSCQERDHGHEGGSNARRGSEEDGYSACKGKTCCVFRPANGSSVHSLVEINFIA